MTNMIVTTALKQEKLLQPLAKKVSIDLQIPYVERKKRSLSSLQKEYETSILIVGQKRLDFYPLGATSPIFFHPNVAMLRYKRLINGKDDPFINATKLTEGMSILDCTLGLASDAIVASLITGQTGKVVGVEGHRVLAYIIKHGLKSELIEDENWNEALKRIEVINSDHLSFLKGCASDSFDVVYFDPMFTEAIEPSNGMNSIRSVALYDDLTEEAFAEAYRVAKKRIVLKDHWQSHRFQKFRLNVMKRPTAKFHFGYLEKR